MDRSTFAGLRPLRRLIFQRWNAAALLLAVGLFAIASEDGSEESTMSATLREGPVRERIEWVLRFVNDGDNTDEIESVFADSFLAAVKPEAVESLAAQQLRPAGPFRIDEVVEQTDTTATLVLRGTRAMTMSITVDPDPPHQIIGLLFQPYRGDVATPASWEELDERLAGAAPNVAFLAAEIVDGECRPVHAVDQDRVLPLGSAFKLYVLGAAADEVAAGRLSWDETVTITDERRVHSSATYGQTPAGSEISLRDAATAMISVSDNTATDLVLQHVGREVVESRQAALGMADPSRNVPFLTTRELTFLKWIVAEDERAAYIAADAATRREIIAALPDRSAVEADLDGVAEPVALDDLEWFASPADLCRVHAALHTKGDEVRRILSVNAGQGITFDRGRWPYIGFKGGSEPGVLALAWVAERSDGRLFFVGALFKDDHGQVANDLALDVATAFELLPDG